MKIGKTGCFRKRSWGIKKGGLQNLCKMSRCKKIGIEIVQQLQSLTFKNA